MTFIVTVNGLSGMGATVLTNPPVQNSYRWDTIYLSAPIPEHIVGRSAFVCVGDNCDASTPTPTLTPTPTPTPTATPPPSPTPAPTPSANAFGNADCGGGINSVDSLKILRYGAGLTYTQTEPCPDIGTALARLGAAGMLTQMGDVDCDEDVDSVDALKILRSVASLPVAQTEPCRDIGA
jgi:hypothetical protein